MITWNDLQAEDIGTTPEKLLDMVRRMRKVMEAEVFTGYPMSQGEAWRDVLIYLSIEDHTCFCDSTPHLSC